MKRIDYDRYGGPEVLRLSDISPTAPADEEIQVRVMAASANPMDWKIRDGAVKMMTGNDFRIFYFVVIR